MTAIEPTTPATAPAQEPPASEAPPTPKPETDWKAEAKKWETRAKENKTAADQLAAIEEAKKTEEQKAADRLAATEKERDDAKREALKFKVASKFSIGDEDADLFLTGTDEESIMKQAERLTAREGERKKNGNVVSKEGAIPQAAATDERAFVRDLFGRGG